MVSIGINLITFMLDSYNCPPWLPSEEASPETTGNSITIPRGHKVIADSSSTHLGLTTQAHECKREKVRSGGKSFFAT